MALQRPTVARGALATAVWILLSGVPAARAAGAPPLLVVRKPGNDLGNVRQKETIRFPVRLENVSRNSIKVVEANTSCTCLKMELPVTLAAGEARDVTATLETKDLEGSLVARLRLAVDGVPDAPKVDVWGNCNIVPEFRRSAAQIDLGRTGAGQAPRQALRIEAVAAKDARIASVGIDSPYFTAEAPAADAAGPWSIPVALRPGACQGEYRALLTVRTTSERCPEIRVPVLCRVDGGYLLTSEQAMLGIRDYESAGEARAMVGVRRADGRPIALARLEASAPYLIPKCGTLGRASEEHSVDIGISLVWGRPPANVLIHEHVTLYGQDGKPFLRLPVTALLRSGEPCCSPGTPEAVERERAALGRGIPPYFRTEDADGNSVDSGVLIGKPALLLFFCGCPACHAVSVDLAKQKYEPFTLYGFLHWSPNEARGFLERTKFPGRLLMDTGARIGARFDVASCPYLIVLDARGRIVHRRLVYLERGEAVVAEARKALERHQSVAAQTPTK